VLDLHGKVKVDKDGEERDAETPFEGEGDAFLRGYLTGMAFALGTTWQDLLRHAQYMSRSSGPGVIDWHGLPDPPEIPKGVFKSDLIKREDNDAE
jgi:hypothetical protein